MSVVSESQPTRDRIAEVIDAFAAAPVGRREAAYMTLVDLVREVGAGVYRRGQVVVHADEHGVITVRTGRHPFVDLGEQGK